VTPADATVDRIKPDYLLSDIAELAHLTKAAVSLYAKCRPALMAGFCLFARM